MTVGVGSFSDPSEIQGLAHFLEHMIFMGSEKYPKVLNLQDLTEEKLQCFKINLATVDAI